MLYGNLIFIKKTGGDGSKYPVTEKNIKIGRSENCLIRIYNPQVAPEHCQLIIDCNGQAKLRNLFSPTILNGKPLGQGDVILCHGDVFKLGERLARWEYLPTSKYFRQLLSPTGRLVAVVNPQRRSVESPSTSATQVSVSKGTSVGGKRKSEKIVTNSSSVPKQRRTIGSDATSKLKIDLGHLLIGRHSIKSGKLLPKTPVIKQRKSVSGVISSRTPKNKQAIKSRKSILPSWKVSTVAQPNQSPQSKISPPKEKVKTPSKRSLRAEVRTPSKSTPIKVRTPKRLKLDSKSGNKTPLNTIMESPLKPNSVRSTRSFSSSPPVKVLSTPKGKLPVAAARLVQSEKKPKLSLGSAKPTKGFRRMSLLVKKGDRGGRISLPQRMSASERKSRKEKVSSNEGEAGVEVSPFQMSNVGKGRKSSGKVASTKSVADSPNRNMRKSPGKTPRKSSAPPNKSSVTKVTDVAQSPALIDFSDEGESVITKRTSRKSVVSSNKTLEKSVRKSSAHSKLDIFQTSQKILKEVSTPPRSRKSGKINSSKKVLSSSKKEVTPRGVRRRLSPSISSAERAAKKLKTSSPKKPDKNKRAALLVLGKANRKQLLSQNLKVLLKQKIVKKAIKQSVVAVPVRKEEQKKTSAKKTKKAGKKKEKKSKASSTKPKRSSQGVKESPSSNKSSEKFLSAIETSTLNIKKSPERSLLNRSKVSSPVPPVKVTSPSTGSVKSTKSTKKTESIPSPKSTNQTVSPYVQFDKSPESYLFSSSRRSSKRLSSKNDTERRDFVELSPTALGLIPKNMDVFKTPKEKKRKSSSLVTPRNVRTTGIIKSASTSKIGNRKSVSFLSKDFSSYTPNINEKTDYDFDSFHASNITMDVFVSPLEKRTSTPVVEFVSDENVKTSEKRSSEGSKKVVRKLLQSPLKEPPNKLSKLSDQTKTPTKTTSDSGVRKPVVLARGRKSPKNDLTDVRGVRRLLTTPKRMKTPKNDLTDVRGVKKLFTTPRVQKSPKNRLSDVKGVKKLLRTPKEQKSPKNNLTDLRGVKKLLATPKEQKSPKNELSDLRGVKKLLTTPKQHKNPKNDLSDLRGVKKLLRTPKEQKGPKNELSDLRGVKKLLTTPKKQKSPKNDLSDLRGVKKLLRTPKEQKSPKNDLSDLRGVKKLLTTPKQQKSPKNDLSDLRGVKKLLTTPKQQNSPKNNLSDVKGVKRLMRTPKEQKSPKNALTDLRGVKRLLQSPRNQKSPKNDLSNVEGVKDLFASPEQQKSASQKVGKMSKSPKRDFSDVTRVRELLAGHKPISDYNVALTAVSEAFKMVINEEEEVEVVKSKGVEMLEVETRTGRGRPRKVDGKKGVNKTAPKTQTRKGSAEVKTRVTRSKKQGNAGNEEKAGVEDKKTKGIKKGDAVKKTTRTRVESKKETEVPEVETKTSRKRKTVETVEASPPKSRRKAAPPSKQSVSKALSIGSRTRGTEGRGKTKDLTKVQRNSKSPAAKKIAKVQTSRTTKSGATSVSKTKKVQKRSQMDSAEESSISPRKTRSVSSRKTRAATAGRK